MSVSVMPLYPTFHIPPTHTRRGRTSVVHVVLFNHNRQYLRSVCSRRAIYEVRCLLAFSAHCIDLFRDCVPPRGLPPHCRLSRRTSVGSIPASRRARASGASTIVRDVQQVCPSRTKYCRGALRHGLMIYPREEPSRV
jgi:hypothetical protein